MTPRLRLLTLPTATVVTSIALLSATTRSASAQAPPPKHARAVRIAGVPPHVDGTLDDAAWRTAPVISDFVQKVPIEGESPSVATEVRLVYDDDALYVGARLRRANPSAIRTSITRRD